MRKSGVKGNRIHLKTPQYAKKPGSAKPGLFAQGGGGEAILFGFGPCLGAFAATPLSDTVAQAQ
jgi:hypothetical protein